MRAAILIIIFWFSLDSVCFSQRGKPSSLVGTKWEYKVTEKCVDYIFFKDDSTYEDYNCEINLSVFGTYIQRCNSISFSELDLASDLPGEKRFVVKEKHKAIIQKGKLKFVSYKELINGKWVKKHIQPSNQSYFTKTK